MKKIALILAILFIVTPCLAQEQSYYLQKFLGLNTSTSPRLLTDSESPDLSNFTLDEIGSITERDLFSQYNTSSPIIGSKPITGLFKFYTTDSKYFVVTGGTKIASASGGNIDTNITNTGITIEDGSFWSACSFNNILYLFNESVAMQKWTGSGATTTPAGYPSTNCRYCAVHKNRLWGANSDTYPYRLYYSSLSDGEDWTTTGGYADLPDLTQHITGLVSWGGNLFIFTETNIYRLFGSTPNNFSLIKTDSDVGAIAPRSIQVTEGGIYFLARTGVFQFNGSRSYKLTDKIDPTINAISKSAIKNSASIWDGQNKYILSYPSSTSSINDSILVYDSLLKEWFPWDGLNINYFVRSWGGTDKGEIYGGSSLSNGIVWLLQSANATENITHDEFSEFDNGTTFNTIVFGSGTSPYLDLLYGRSEQSDNCKLYLHFDGTDNATSASDYSTENHTLTFYNEAYLDADYKMFGTASLYTTIVGSNGRVEISDSSDWDVFATATEEWTIDFWIKSPNAAGAGTETIIAHYEDATHYWKLDRTTQRIELRVRGGTGNIDIDTDANSFISTNWRHVALVKIANEYGIYIDGIQEGYTQDNDTGDFSGTLFISCLTTGSNDFTGWIDELRINKYNIFNASPNATNTNSITLPSYRSSGTLHSDNLAINASGGSTLGDISWTEELQNNTDIQFTTRTGTTYDTVYWNGWETWVSTSTVIAEVSASSVIWETYRSSSEIDVSAPTVSDIPDINRDIDFYETDDSNSPNCVKITFGANITDNSVGLSDRYVDMKISKADLSGYTFLGYWLMSNVTGDVVQLGFGEDSVTENTITANVVQPNTWEYHYWNLADYTDTDIDEVTGLSVRWVEESGVTTRPTVFLGEITAYDFLDSDETITSTPNDYIQYRAVLGALTNNNSPEVQSVIIEYTPQAATTEASMDSYYKTKQIDFGTPMKNKQFLELYLECASADNYTTISTVYDIDSGTKTGTLYFPIKSTPNTVRIKKTFPRGNYGKNIELDMEDTDKDAQVTVRALELRYVEEPLN